MERPGGRQTGGVTAADVPLDPDVRGAVVRGGVPSGLTADGKTKPLRATAAGEQRVAELSVRELLGEMLLELRAIRAGLEVAVEEDLREIAGEED